MLAYWEARCDLFGEERMLLPMHRSSALCPEDAPALEQGMLQILPQRDAEGRALLFFDPSRRDVRLGCSTESMVRDTVVPSTCAICRCFDSARGLGEGGGGGRRSQMLG